MTTSIPQSLIDMLLDEVSKTQANRPGYVKKAIRGFHAGVNDPDNYKAVTQWISEVTCGSYVAPSTSNQRAEDAHRKVVEAQRRAVGIGKLDSGLSKSLKQAIRDLQSLDSWDYNPDRYDPAAKLFGDWYDQLRSEYDALYEQIVQLRLRAEHLDVEVDSELDKDDIQYDDGPVIYGHAALMIEQTPSFNEVVEQLNLIRGMENAIRALHSQIREAELAAEGFDRCSKLLGMAPASTQRC